MPSSNERALEKAKTLAADGLIFDLEDAVAPASKEFARLKAVQASGDDGYTGKEVVIRVNAISTEWFVDDVRAVSQSKADAILLPKAESAHDIEQVESLLGEANQDIDIWCMIETPKGILNANEIAASSKRVAYCLVLGTVDLANEIHCKPMTEGRWNLMSSIQMCILAARANNVAVLDGVYVDIKDDDGFKKECIQGRDLGFDGKTLIHPKMIAVTNEVYSPRADEIEHAKQVVEAHEAAIATGSGVATVNGKLVEVLHVRDAHRILQLASRIKH
eukprot:CAMPEP_0203795042 /NCGR_PEP_ID=MMETSP0100_2-20121128/6953_1 /ASSEMBLY_ACC=CAM_ASM_000210 /TAXON_ID=96639 /ORGANISM=" , Strain NY0313808BC1" /LENGTH=275 /DNA_ID=CAMNT_0050699393 /DNA_START=308 /DNA_END=1135 /DNA_ORIENTATION=+